jgi:ABC-type bacteriocin/lantibiotic exporter with double-glycine peptidase domain
MVFGYYGTIVSEEELGRAAGTKIKFGTPPECLLRVANAYGFEGKWKKNATVCDLRAWFDKGVPVIVNWFSTDEGHYSPVIGVDDTHVTIMDPDTGKRRSFHHETFMRVWFDFTPLWIEKPSQLRIRWMLPLVPKLISPRRAE